MKTLCSLLCVAIAFGCSPTFGADKGKIVKTVTAKVSKEKAQAAAMKLVPGEFLCWDLQIEDGTPEYAFYIRGKDGRISEAEMDGNTGKKTNIGVLIESSSADGSKIKTTNAADLARLKEPKLTREQTQEKALKAYPGTIEAWELLLWESGAEGKLVFDFRISGKDGKRVVTVDSKTGAIVSISTFVKGQGR
ncbi:MAG: PepSY domain-containing protein [Candidatus Obscuribacterales bacterium]|nr:PepSY domain-containing protein [Candidatus Obscuribacterales bacterium]